MWFVYKTSVSREDKKIESTLSYDFLMKLQM